MKLASCIKMDKEYQQKHAMFVSNNSGTTPETLLLINSVVPLSSLMLRLLLAILNRLRYQVSVEVLIIVIPLVLAFTVWSSRIHIILLVLAAICLILFAIKYIIRRKNEDRNQFDDRISHTNRFFPLLEAEVCSEKIYKTLLTEYRSHLLLSTAVCILAVDFPIFPRYLAKTETYGWSLMDVGVGCFVIANGVASGQARGKIYSNKYLQIHNVFKSSIPIILIGMMRLIATRSVGYHEHVSEYGVHWNFFITLALTKVICTLILVFLPSVSCGILSSAFILFYQYLLTACGVSDYLFSTERKNIIQANKEGIYSLLGYISLYFAGVELGKFLSRKRITLREWIKALFFIFGVGYFTWVMMQFVCSNIESISRRTTNLSYVLWILSFYCYEVALHLLGLIIVEILEIQASHDPVSTHRTHLDQVILWNAINGNALFYFLFANIITGIINISVQTIYSSTHVSLLIILMYAITLSLSAVFLHTNSIKTKIW